MPSPVNPVASPSDLSRRREATAIRVEEVRLGDARHGLDLRAREDIAARVRHDAMLRRGRSGDNRRGVHDGALAQAMLASFPGHSLTGASRRRVTLRLGGNAGVAARLAAPADPTAGLFAGERTSVVVVGESGGRNGAVLAQVRRGLVRGLPLHEPLRYAEEAHGQREIGRDAPSEVSAASDGLFAIPFHVEAVGRSHFDSSGTVESTVRPMLTA